MATKRYRNAALAGKFLPFHNGHRSLILRAVDAADHVDILLVANEKNDHIDPNIRALSIYEELVGQPIRVHIVDDIYTDDTVEESSIVWAEYTRAILGYTPDVVVASEDYGARWAKYMGVDFIMHDQARLEIPVSGTMCRENAFANGRYMPEATRRYMLPRIVVLGAESTGTTTLANQLGEHYNTLVVPEVGRLLDERAVDNGTYQGDIAWDDQRFWLTSRAQDAMEERYASKANGVLICDTDSLATAVWYEYYHRKGTVSGNVWPYTFAGMRQASKHALYILTWDDIPFVQDERGTRTGEDLRRWHTEKFNTILDLYLPPGVDYIIVKGSREERYAAAVEAVERVLDRHSVLC